MASHKVIDKILAQMCATYPQKPATSEEFAALAATWQDVLDDVPDELLTGAAREYLKSGAQWRPAPGQLRERVLELTNNDANELAERAWQGIVDCDYGRAPQYLVDPALAREVMRRLGGFDRMGETPSEWINLKWREPFLKMYAELKRREQANGLMMLGAGAANPKADALLAQTAQRLTATLKGNGNGNGHGNARA